MKYVRINECYKCILYVLGHLPLWYPYRCWDKREELWSLGSSCFCAPRRSFWDRSGSERLSSLSYVLTSQCWKWHLSAERNNSRDSFKSKIHGKMYYLHIWVRNEERAMPGWYSLRDIETFMKNNAVTKFFHFVYFHFATWMSSINRNFEFYKA